MRCSHPERACTFIFTTLLFILSFTITIAESANTHGFAARHAWRKRASLDVIPTGQAATSIPESLLPTTILPLSISPTTPTSLPSLSPPTLSPFSPLSPLSLSSLQTSNPTTTSSSSDSSTPSSPSPSPTSTSSTITTTITTTSQPQAPTISNGTPLSSSSSSHPSSSQHSSSTTPSTSVVTVGAATPTAQASVTLGYSGPGTDTSDPTGTIISTTPSSTSSSDSGFFSNTGAVAGTFTIAGLFGVAGIIGVGMLIARRRASRSYEDDMEYLEKKHEPAVETSQSQNFVIGDADELSDLSHVNNSMEVTIPPAAHLYPQHDIYFPRGHANGSDGSDNQGYYSHVAYAPQQYGIAYPPGESYAEEDAYGGMDEAQSEMPNPFDSVATELPAASQDSSQRLRTATPPLTAYLHRSIDSFYGSSAGASHGHVM